MAKGATVDVSVDEATSVIRKHLEACWQAVAKELRGRPVTHDDDFVSNDEFLSLLKVALLSPECNSIIYQLREANNDKVKLENIREASTDELSRILSRLSAPLRADVKNECSLLHKSLSELRNEIDVLLNERLDVKTLMIPGELKERFNQEYPEEKKQLSNGLLRYTSNSPFAAFYRPVRQSCISPKRCEISSLAITASSIRTVPFLPTPC